MSSCEYCKTSGQKTGSCAFCGPTVDSCNAFFIYGNSLKEAGEVEITLTNRYLIVRKISAAEGMGTAAAGAAFGALGVLVASAATSAKKKTYAFYDLQDVQKVIHPYCVNDYSKKEHLFKFINKDGSDFVLRLSIGLFNKKYPDIFAEKLASSGLYIEDGSSVMNPSYCFNPLVNAETFGLRVCPSAAAFVNMSEKQQQVVYSSGNVTVRVNQQPKTYQQAPMPTQSPFAPPPVQQPVYQQPVYQQPVYQQPSAPQPAPSLVATQKVCPSCGFAGASTSNFCTKCGTSLL